MKKLFALVLALMLAFSGCGWEVEIVDPSEQIAELEKPETEKPSEENTVTEEFIEEIVLNFGAEKEADGTYRVAEPFSFYRNTGGYEDFQVIDQSANSLYGMGAMLGKEYLEEIYVSDLRYEVYNAETFEKMVHEYFGISGDVLKNTIHYNEFEELGGAGYYWLDGPYYIEEDPVLTVESFEQGVNILEIYLKVDYENNENDTRGILTVKLLADGRYNYLGYYAEKESSKEPEIVEPDFGEIPAAGTENEYGIEAEKIEYARKLIENYEEVKSDEKFVYRGEDRKIITAPLEKFIESVENNESGSVFGVLAGEPTLYYFELSFVPGGLMDFIWISPFDVFAAEFSEVYDNEIVCYFSDGEETSFSVRKTERFAGEKTEHSPEEDIPGMPVTIEAAKERAKAVLLSENGMSGYGERYGTGATLIREDYSASADEYVKSLEPKCEGIYEIGGKLYYLFYFYSGENSTGEGYYICAENIELILGINQADGGLMPIVYLANPGISIEK